MKIASTIGADTVQLTLDGRLDASWSGTAAAAFDEAIRSGRSSIQLDLTAVSFISSVGIGVIMSALTRFRAVGGKLEIVAASDSVREMLRISRLDKILLATVATGSTAKVAKGLPTQNSLPFGGGWVGELTRLGTHCAHASFVKMATVHATRNTLAIGHLALAASAENARGFFGDGLIASGTITLAPAESPRPDFLASTDAGTVQCIARDTLIVDAAPSLRGYFEWDGTRPVALSALATALVRAEGGAVAFLVIGECRGAFGAWARTSPDLWMEPAESMSPSVMRTSLSFAGEPMHSGESMVVVCFAADHAAHAALPEDIRAALIQQEDLFLHAHVAVASYRPVPQSTIDASFAGRFLAEQPLRSVMHALIGSDGVETSFVRGSVWAVRIGGAS